VLRDLVSVRNIQSNRSSAPLGIARRIHGVPARVGELDQAGRKPKALVPNRINARPAQNPGTLGGDIEGGNYRSTVQPAERAGGVLHVFFEGKWARVRLPTGQSRLEPIADRWAHVKEAGARSTA